MKTTMKTPTKIALLLFVPSLLAGLSLPLRAAQPWQQITMPTVAEAAATFPNPPLEYGAIHWALGFPPPKERILADIERVAANGGSGYMINSGGRSPKYLSPEYLELWKFAVDECKKHGLKMWIDGDDGYPDGFAGGMISRDYPQLGMQGIIADCRYTIAGGQTLSIPLPTDTLGIVANPRAAMAAPGGPAAEAAAPGPTNQVLSPSADGRVKWTAPGSTVSGADRFLSWEVVVQGNGVEGHYSVVAGQTLNIQVPPDTKSVQAVARTGGRGGGGGGGGRGVGGGRGGAPQPSTVIPLPADGQFKWTAPGTGTWEVTFVRHLYRSSPTRAGQREDATRDKDSLYSLIDYLDPQATATYIKLVEETYGKVAGDEFGKTILGFRGDETDYTGFIPWTPKLLETFQKQKGYDLKPYIAQFFATPLTPEAQRAKADYWDVWSGMFRDNFYKPMQDWCRAHHMDYMLHLNHEEVMVSRGGEDMIKNEGSFWRDMRYIGVPGVDNLSQIGPGIVADFPKLAGSAAHLYGRPQVWTEAGGEPGQNGKFVFDYQLVRGINYMNIRGLNDAPRASGGASLDPAAAFGHYVSRAQHLMAIGRPAAQVALFHPTDSYWMSGTEAQESDTVTVKLTTQLMEQQIDFDHIDADTLATICTLSGGGLKNLSGQVYRAVIIPSSLVIQKNVLERLRAFAKAGGKVIFVGRTPTMVVNKTFLHPEAGVPDLSFATLEPTPDITAKVVAALPKPDVKLDAACPPIKYMRRSLKDGEVYFFFNESNQTQTRTATLAGNGQAQVWDAASGTIHKMTDATAGGGSVKLSLVLEPYESKFIVLGPLPATAGAPEPSLAAGDTILELAGDWTVSLGDQKLTTPLKSWADLGAPAFSGIAQYRKEFTLASVVPGGKGLYLECNDAREIARVRLNGVQLEARAWRPYRWDVTKALKSGANVLEVEVQGLGGGGRRGGGAPPPAGGAGAAGARGVRGVAGAMPAPGGGAAGGGAGRGARGGEASPAAAGLLPPVRLVAR
jgi:alpha-L-rhamnosidase